MDSTHTNSRQSNDLEISSTPYLVDAPGPSSVNLIANDIASVIWATGFDFDFSWIDFPVFDEFGYPIQQQGRTAIAGLHFLGMNYIDTRGSGILYGVGSDAEQLGRIIVDELPQ